MSLAKLFKNSVKQRGSTISSTRYQIQQQLFDPERFKHLKTISADVGVSTNQIPRLWVPPLCHYKTDGKNVSIDSERNTLHLKYLSDYIGGYLVNGTTGDGWTLTFEQQQSVLKNTLDFMHAGGNKDTYYFKPILISILAHDVEDKMNLIDGYIDFLINYYNISNIDDIYSLSPFVGFAVTPQSNTNNQKEIENGLSQILTKYSNFPFALYQLPQVTYSEMSIDLLCNLLTKFGNILYLKDSSGTDNIAKSQRNLDGIFMVRGMEGNQIESLLNINNGCSGYNGLLLSTANNYPNLLNQMITDIMNYNFKEAAVLSSQITNISTQTLKFSEKFDFGNPFTNSAKLVDFWCAYSMKSEDVVKNIDNIPISSNGIKYDAKDLMSIKDILKSNNYEYLDGYLKHKQWWKKH